MADRLAEIRRRWTNHEDTPADVAWLLERLEVAKDVIRDLMTQAEKAKEVADAARALVEQGNFDLRGICCLGDLLKLGSGTIYRHAPDCPWLRARALLEGERCAEPR